jgi:SNF2 family DNA or RNA helicase
MSMNDILHGTWVPAKQCFFLWGEATESNPARGRRKLKPHPFQLPLDTLYGLLERLLPADLVAAIDTGSYEYPQTLWLPATAKTPLPSPELLATGSVTAPTEPPELLPWQVVGLALPITIAVDLLPALTEPRHLGADLHAWRTATLLALELLAGQQLLPTLVRDGFQLRAVWRPQPTADTAQKVGTLARSMPPLCRAAVDELAAAPSARTLLGDFLTAVVDSTVRELALTSTLPATTPGGKWLQALLGKDSLVPLKGPAADALYKSWQDWSGQGQVAGDDVFRITFRLEPPDEAEQPWELTYLLQATDEPSLLVPVKDIWRERGAAFTYLDRRFEHPQERLLTGLGFAARLFPPLQNSLRQAAPDRATLDTPEAFTFLKEATPLLEQSGFGVLVPAWLQGKGARLQAKAQVKSPPNEKGMLSFEKMISFSWELALGDQPLDLAEFERLVALKMPLVQVRGQWVVLDPEHMQQALRFFKQRDGSMSLIEALRLGLGGDGQALPPGVEVAGVEAEGWLGEALRGLSNPQQLDLLPPPDGLQATLRPYQVRGYSWLAFLQRFGLGACLADDMGLGKCMLGDTLIEVNGVLRTAEDLWQVHAHQPYPDNEGGMWAEPLETLQVNALDNQTGAMVLAPIRRLYRQYVCEPLRKITLVDGSSITITRRHQLLTERGWTHALQVGDIVCVPAHTCWEGTPEDPDLVQFLAWQIAEGYELTEQATLSISQKDTERLEQLRQTLERIGQKYDLKVNTPAIRVNQRGVAALTINSRSYQRFLEARGYTWGQRSRDKTIPDWVMQADRESIRVFLRNYFAAEAAVVSSMRSIEISTASATLIQQLAALLRRFGIWLRIAAKQKRATNGTGIFRTYYTGTLGGNAARRFLHAIGLEDSRKSHKLTEICARTSNTNVEGIPASAQVGRMVAATGLPVRHFGMHNTVYLDGTQQFSRASLERVLTGIDDILSGAAEQRYRRHPRSRWTERTLAAYAGLDRPELSATRHQVQHLLDQDVFYCRITSIEDVMHTGYVYDFEIQTQHNFVANNIVCHNTIQTISLLLHDREQEAHPAPTLLVCPTSVIGNWQREVQRFAPALRVLVHQGPGRPQGDPFVQAAQEHDLVLTSFPLLARDRDTLTGVEWGAVVLDEAQNIKNAGTKQAQAARALTAPTRIALTGTPVENRLTELWSIMAFLNPGYLGNETAFRRDFARPIERTGDENATARLRQLTAPFILRRLKTDKTIIADLPDKIEKKEYCRLTPEQATLYESVVRDALAQIENADTEENAIQRKGLVLAMLMKLKQVCNHPAQFLKDGSAFADRSGKLARLSELLEEIYAAGDRVLIFTQFAELGEMLRLHLSERLYEDVLFLHGGTKARERDGLVRRFQAPGGPTVFILSIKAGGTGLNLTAANHVVHFDRWWNPAVENQATDRAFRIGQQRNVEVHKFVCTGTLEERIDEMIESKRTLAEQVLGSDESWLTSLSTNQLRDLVALRQDAIASEEE